MKTIEEIVAMYCYIVSYKSECFEIGTGHQPKTFR